MATFLSCIWPTAVLRRTTCFVSSATNSLESSIINKFTVRRIGIRQFHAVQGSRAYSVVAEAASAPTKPSSPAEKLRILLKEPGIITMPCCFDGFSAKLIEQAGFKLTFMSGFSTSAARLGLPDTGLISYAEMVDSGRNICDAVAIPVIGDGDTGYGNSVNLKRTVRGYAKAGFAAIMLEDQVSPKRCGHTKVKAVVPREEAFARIRAAVDARDNGADILIMARTDARSQIGLDEAIYRAQKFAEIGADITFVEAPRTVEELARVSSEVPGPKMANMLEFGQTPILPPNELQALGFKIAAYPLTLLSAGAKAMREALRRLKTGEDCSDILLSFDDLQKAIGFPEYFEDEARYVLPDASAKKGSS